MLISLLKQIKAGTEYLNYGRDIIVNWGAEALAGIPRPRILDIGAGSGSDLTSIAEHLGSSPELHGIDCRTAQLKALVLRP